MLLLPGGALLLHGTCILVVQLMGKGAWVQQSA